MRHVIFASLLLGVFLEHYENPNAKTLASNTGVGIVLPVEYIRQVLMKDELVEQRRAADAAKTKSGDAERKQARATSDPSAGGRARTAAAARAR